MITATKKPTPATTNVEAHREQADALAERMEEKTRRDEADEKTKRDRDRDRVRARLLRGEKITDADLPVAFAIQRDEILPAAIEAELDEQHAKKIRATKGTAGQMRRHIESAADALETFCLHLSALCKLSPKFSKEVRELGGTTPYRFGIGQQLKWAVVMSLENAWRGFLKIEPLAPQTVRKFAFGQLTLRDVDTALLAISRERKESTQ